MTWWGWQAASSIPAPPPPDPAPSPAPGDVVVGPWGDTERLLQRERRRPRACPEGCGAVLTAVEMDSHLRDPGNLPDRPSWVCPVRWSKLRHPSTVATVVVEADSTAFTAAVSSLTKALADRAGGAS